MVNATASPVFCTLSACTVGAGGSPAAQGVSLLSVPGALSVGYGLSGYQPAFHAQVAVDDPTDTPTDTATPTATPTVTVTATPDPTAPQYVTVQSVSPEMAYVIAVPVFLLSALLVVMFALIVRGGGS